VSVYKPEPTAWEIVENHKGFAVRKCKRGFLAFKDGRNLMTQPTVEDAIRSIDEHLERERKAAIARAEQAKWQAELEAENAERQRQAVEAVFACIQPIRDFVEQHGLDMLQSCVGRLEFEECERNVPSNWEELVEIAERIGERHCEGDWREEVGEVDVDRYGVIEHRYYNSNCDGYASTVEFGLQEYVDAYKEDYLPEDENEDDENEEPSLRHTACFADIQNEGIRQERMLEASGV